MALETSSALSFPAISATTFSPKSTAVPAPYACVHTHTNTQGESERRHRPTDKHTLTHTSHTQRTQDVQQVCQERNGWWGGQDESGKAGTRRLGACARLYA